MTTHARTADDDRTSLMRQRPFVFLPLAVLAVTHAAADDIKPAALGSRTVRFTYEARVTPPAGTRVLEMWLPLPREDDQRRCVDAVRGGLRGQSKSFLQFFMRSNFRGVARFHER